MGETKMANDILNIWWGRKDANYMKKLPAYLS